MGPMSTCYSNYVEIIEPTFVDRDDTDEDIVLHYCGGNVRQSTKRSKTNKLSIRYKKTVNFIGNGWQFHYSARQADRSFS